MGTGELLGQPDKMLGGNLWWTSIPPRGSSDTPSRLHVTVEPLLWDTGHLR